MTKNLKDEGQNLNLRTIMKKLLNLELNWVFLLNEFGEKIRYKFQRRKIKI